MALVLQTKRQRRKMLLEWSAEDPEKVLCEHMNRCRTGERQFYLECQIVYRIKARIPTHLVL